MAKKTTSVVGDIARRLSQLRAERAAIIEAQEQPAKRLGELSEAETLAAAELAAATAAEREAAIAEAKAGLERELVRAVKVLRELDATLDDLETAARQVQLVGGFPSGLLLGLGGTVATALELVRRQRPDLLGIKVPSVAEVRKAELKADIERLEGVRKELESRKLVYTFDGEKRERIREIDEALKRQRQALASV